MTRFAEKNLDLGFSPSLVMVTGTHFQSNSQVEVKEFFYFEKSKDIDKEEHSTGRLRHTPLHHCSPSVPIMH